MLVVLAGLLSGCSGDEDPPAQVPWPEDIKVYIDQSRMLREGRQVYLRIDNETEQTIDVTGYRLSSPRFDDVRWVGSEQIDATFETDLELAMPRARCGPELAARVELTYRLDDGEPRRSSTVAQDRYGNAEAVADRDCAERTLREAAGLAVGMPQVAGSGADSVLELPVTLTPTGGRSDVRVLGFGSTPLFRQHANSPTDIDLRLAGGRPVTLTMRVVPARCDAHALAEDKVGRLFPLAVAADGVSAGSSFFLPLTGPQREAFYTYFATRCGA